MEIRGKNDEGSRMGHFSMLWMAGCTIHSTISKFDDYAVVPMSKSECSLKSAEVSKNKIIVNVARFGLPLGEQRIEGVAAQGQFACTHDLAGGDHPPRSGNGDVQRAGQAE